MSITAQQSVSLIPATGTSAVGVKDAANRVRQLGQGSEDQDCFNMIAQALQNIQNALDALHLTLSAPVPQAQVQQITDPSGTLVGQVGHMLGPSDNKSYSGAWWGVFYGGGQGPDTALLIIQPGSITLKSVNFASGVEFGGLAGISATVVLAKITGGGANGSLTITDGGVTAYTPPT